MLHILSTQHTPTTASAASLTQHTHLVHQQTHSALVTHMQHMDLHKMVLATLEASTVQLTSPQSTIPSTAGNHVCLSTSPVPKD